MNTQRTRRSRLRGEEGYLLIIAMIALLIVGIMASGLLVSVARNQQHVSRDRAYTQSLAVAEAGLNQYLWMVAAGTSFEGNNFIIPGNTEADPHKQTITLANADSVAKGTYTIEVTPPTGSDSRIGVTVTGQADSGAELARTVSAHIGRPAFSEYVLLVDESVSIGGPQDRVWHGKTHSNTGVKIETGNINDTVTCAQSSYIYNSSSKPGVWSDTISSWAAQYKASNKLWKFPVPAIDFSTVTSDFVELHEKADGTQHDLPYVGSTYLGWYIRLLDDEQYQVARVTAEVEKKGYDGSNYGGTLTTETLGAVREYPDNGVIYVNDDVWVEGTADKIDGRLTIASSGQLNTGAGHVETSINIVGDILYSEKDGTVAIGFIAQNNIKIPMYAPRGSTGTPGTDTNNQGTINMEIDGALIAQEGSEYVSRDSSSTPIGPRRRLLTFYGSVSTYGSPYRVTTSGTNYCGFAQGANVYDPFLLHSPPPYFPTIGSYQILDWRELPDSQAVSP